MQILREQLVDAVSAITVRYFGLHGRGETNYHGAPLFWAEPLAEIERVARMILQTETAYSSLFSTKYVSRLVQDAVTDTIRRGDLTNVPTMIDRLYSRLSNTDQKKRIYIPISGVQFEGTLDVGPFRLRWMDTAATEQAIRLVQRSIGWTTNSSHHKFLEKRGVRREIKKHVREKPCFEFEENGDTAKVEEQALGELPTLFDLLRYSVPADPDGEFKRRNIVIGLPVEGRPGAYERYIVPLGKSDGAYGGSWSPTGTLKIDADQLEFMAQLGVFQIAASLERPQTDFEADLLNAIHWYAEAQVQVKPEHELVSLIVAAETLIPRKHSGDGVTGAVCDAVALCLCSQWDERLKLYTFMRDAYTARGEVSHRGSRTAYSSLSRLRHIVQMFIAKSIENPDSFTTGREFRAWVDGRNSGLFGAWKAGRGPSVENSASAL